MGVRFIVGRAGSGKTYRCVESIRTQLASDATSEQKLILLVPEQASLQMERALLRQPGPGASHRAEVLSFRRLAYRILQSATTQPLSQVDHSTHVSPDSAPLRLPNVVLTEMGRVMAIRHLLGRLKDRLGYYRRSDRSPGFWKKMADTVGELLDERVSAADLRATSTAIGVEPLQAQRLADLAEIFDAYQQFLGEDRADPRALLSIAGRLIPTCEWLKGARVWMDGFAGLTRQELHATAALAAVAEQVEISVLCDPRAVRDRPDPGSLFHRTAQTYHDLNEALIRGGVQVDEPVLLEPDQVPRFGKSRILAKLEKDIFREPEVANALGNRPSPLPLSRGERGLEVALVRVADLRTEVQFVIAKVLEWVRTGERPMRYRDIAIIARNLQPYHSVFSSALAEHDIPYFIDHRRSTAHHPVVELIRGLISLMEDDYSPESVCLLLKSGLVVHDSDGADELENYLLATGITGRKRWLGAKWESQRSDRLKLDEDADDEAMFDLERIDAVRREFLMATEVFARVAESKSARSGREWAQALAAAMDALEVADRPNQWAKASEDNGDLDQAEEHRQIIRDTTELLRDLQQALGDEVMTLGELRQVMEAGLAQFTLGLAPPMLDQVLVGSIERSRHPELRGVIIVGFNEGQFPAVPDESPILVDDDRGLLERRSIRVGRRRQQELLDDRLLFYTAVTRPSERLVITCPQHDLQGKALIESPYAADLLAACPDVEQIDLTTTGTNWETWRLINGGDLARALAEEFSTRPPHSTDDPERRAMWNELYEQARLHAELRGTLGRALSSLAYENHAVLEANAHREALPSPVPSLRGRGEGEAPALRASVSELETFAACPFKHFAQWRLRLRERRRAELESVDVGRLHHAVLERFVKRLDADRVRMSELGPAEVEARLAASCGEVGLDRLVADELSSARDRYVLRRSEQELRSVLAMQARVLRGGRFHPRAAELRFGFDEEESFPGLLLKTPKGRTVVLRGVIDRVDLAELGDELLGVVVDYKRYRGEKPRVQLSKVYHGLSLQLLGYLLVLAEQGRTLAGRPIAPIGALYVPLRESYQKVDHPSEAKPTESVRGLETAPRGIIQADQMAALDSGIGGRASSLYQVSFKVDGGISDLDKSDAVGAESFQELLAHTRLRLGELADSILDGRIEISPYRQGTFTPCSWCVFGDVCRFEFGQPGLRFLEQLKRSEVFARLANTPNKGGAL